MCKVKYINKVFDINLIKKLIIALTLGLNSGVVYAFLVTTTTTYFKDNNLSLTVIGFLSIKTIPYSFKYLWSPLVDCYPIKMFSKNFGLRKSWIMLMQVFLMLTIGFFGYIDIKSISFLVVYLIFIGFIGATYDIAMEAYRIELFSKIKAGIGNAFVVYGFRIGFIISGIFALFLSTIIDWKYVFMILAFFILPCLIVIYFSDEKVTYFQKMVHLNYKEWIINNFIIPFKKLALKPKFGLILTIIAFYKVSDAYLDTLSIPFLMDVGFSKNQIASVAKSCGIVGALIGTLIGGILIAKSQLKYNLLFAEILASITNLQFLIFLKIKNSIILLGLINLIESLSYGISNIILITFMSSLCDKKHLATHYAILISFSGLTKSLISPTSGIVVESFGWQNFFIFSSLLSIPSIFCIYLLYWYKKKFFAKI
ncbi:MFS transporter [Rickettsiales endosymbiont of Trichoplax sp. H2]|uniref:MFS transporter n=1 Tax=Rickettsiales endosymbiont of Trichoplax sp. H2 TaxID=2021221 RepID=UPI0012B2AFA5|nr:MFS transporter [Rickettsiales endosymbiont of Trichoplax sp. H2]MSO13626.1 putative transporter AmpG 4 [Rickettsiales endosymbiont of Trichoplax sp. H2]